MLQWLIIMRLRISKIDLNSSEAYRAYVGLLKDKFFLVNLVIAFILQLVAINISNEAGFVATQAASAPVTDLIISHVPRIDTYPIHAELSGIFFKYRIFFIVLMLPYAPFALYAMSLIMLTRSVFINLTNLGIPIDSRPIVSTGTFGGDLFFSGHVAFPFMLALIFWNLKLLRYFFLILTVVFGLGALLGHYHYSIDVFAAPFITYGIFNLSKKLFKDMHLYTDKYEYLYKRRK